jgi:SAM-dependent methyltransferase
MIPEHFAMIREGRDRFWWYAGRRDLFEKLLRRYRSAPCSFAADLGCGPAANAAIYPALAKRWLCTDISKKSFEGWGQEEGQLRLLADAVRLPITDETMPLALLLDVLEHLPKERPVLKEIRRVLMPGGLLLVSVPAFKALWSWHDEQAGHYRRYRLGDIERIAATEGFEVLRACYYNSLLAIPIFLARKLFRLMPFMKSKIESDLSPGLLNGLLRLWLRVENSLSSRGAALPFGTSAVLLLRKSSATHGDAS